MFWLILQIIFIWLKLNGSIDWSWWWVWAPIWIQFAVGIVIGLLAHVIGAMNGDTPQEVQQKLMNYYRRMNGF